MKISQDQFDKLPQLDRIEFRQKRQFIEDNHQGMGSFRFLFQMILLIVAITMFGVLLFQTNTEAGTRILMIIPILLKITWLGFSIVLILDIYFIYRYIEEKKKLFDYYFKTEVKLKRRKN